MKLPTLVIILFSLLLFSLSSYAKCRERTKAKYKTSKGWSKYYDVEITFMSGQEMNEATNTYKYNGPAYAIIFWSQEQVTVIKLDMLYPGVDISCTFINSLFKVEGKDQDGDYWSICTHNYCI